MAKSTSVPAMATTANETRHSVELFGSTSDSRLINPGNAKFSVTAYARIRSAGTRRHSACRVCTTISQSPSSVKLVGAKAW
jgi:hypothetical protein